MQSTTNLCETLQSARKACRISQLELALRLEVSQRHVSFVESGRAQPSRGLLLAWLDQLKAPLALRNVALQQAGFAPAYSRSELQDAVLAPARSALTQLLQASDPQPAMLMDAAWNVLELNRGAMWLAQLLMPALLAEVGPGPLNMLDALCHPAGMARQLKNLEEVGPAVLAHLRDDASVLPELLPRVAQFTDLLKQRLGHRALTVPIRQMAPVLTSRFDTVHGELAFFSIFSTFGTPQSITLASLRIEHLFAADAYTAQVFKTQVG